MRERGMRERERRERERRERERDERERARGEERTLDYGYIAIIANDWQVTNQP